MSSTPTKQIDGDVAIRRNAAIGGKATVRGSATVDHNLRVKGWLDAPNIKGPNKGLFKSDVRLREVYPKPHEGWWALVGDTLPAPLYISEGGEWVATGESAGNPSIDCDQYNEAVETFSAKLEELSDEVTATKENIAQVLVQIDSICASVVTLTTDVSDIKIRVRDAESRITATESAVGSALTMAETAKNAADCANTAMEALKTSVDIYSETVEGYRTDSSSRYDDLSGRVQRGEETDATHDDEISDLKEKSRHAFTRISELETEREQTILPKVENLEGELSSQSQAIEMLQEADIAQDKRFGDLEERVSGNETELRRIVEGDVSDIREDMGVLRELINENADSLDAAAPKIAALEGATAEHKTAIQRLNNDLGELQEPVLLGLPVIEAALKKMPFVELKGILDSKGELAGVEYSDSTAGLWYVKATREFYVLLGAGDYVGPQETVSTLFGATVAIDSAIYLCGREVYTVEESGLTRRAEENAVQQMLEELSVMLENKLDASYWKWLNGKCEREGYYDSEGVLLGSSTCFNSGLVPLNRDYPLTVHASAASVADLCRLVFFKADGSVTSMGEATEVSEGRIIVQPTDFPADAVFFAVSDCGVSTPGSYENGPEGVLERRENAMAQAIVSAQKKQAQAIESVPAKILGNVTASPGATAVDINAWGSTKEAEGYSQSKLLATARIGGATTKTAGVMTPEMVNLIDSMNSQLSRNGVILVIGIPGEGGGYDRGDGVHGYFFKFTTLLEVGDIVMFPGVSGYENVSYEPADAGSHKAGCFTGYVVSVSEEKYTTEIIPLNGPLKSGPAGKYMGIAPINVGVPAIVIGHGGVLLKYLGDNYPNWPSYEL